MKTLKSLVETFRTVAKHEQGVKKAGETAPPKKYKDNTPVSLKGNVPAESAGTQEFIDDHEIEMLPDVNGNGDDVFKASNIKHSVKGEPRHGYTAKQSANVNEMSDAQMKKREEIVKSMKKNFSDFKKRYGEDAKSVMYATATKQAVKEDLAYENILEAVEAHKAILKEEEDQLIDAYSTILESIYDTLESDEEKEMFNEILESDDAFDQLMEAVEAAIQESTHTGKANG